MKKLGIVVGKLGLLTSTIFAIMVFLVIVLMIVTGDVANPAVGEADARSLLTDPMYYAQIVAFIAGAWLMVEWFETKNGWRLGLSLASKPFLRLGQGLLLGIGAISVSFLGIWATGGIVVHTGQMSGSAAIEMVEWFGMFILVAANEEIVSRGYVQGMIRHHYGTIAGIVVSAVLFALLHGMNKSVWESPWPILILILAGVLFALSRELTGGLWLPIGFHLTWNFFQGNVFGFSVSGEQVNSLLTLQLEGPQWLSGGEFGAEGSVVTAAVLTVVCLLLVNRIKMTHRTGSQELTESRPTGTANANESI